MTSGPFWDFAVASYGRDGVAPACLALQDRYGADVNVLLFCFWLATDDQSLSPALNEAMAISRRWQEVVAPLRQARRGLKQLGPGFSEQAAQDVAATLRERVKSAELDAERCECAALADLAPIAAPKSAPDRSRALANLQCYFAAMNFSADPLGDGDILRIVDVLCMA